MTVSCGSKRTKKLFPIYGLLVVARAYRGIATSAAPRVEIARVEFPKTENPVWPGNVALNRFTKEHGYYSVDEHLWTSQLTCRLTISPGLHRRTCHSVVHHQPTGF
jgi:hypothetical protein